MDVLTALRRQERAIALVRWVAVAFALAQVALYRPPVPLLADAAAQARPVGFALAGSLAVVGIIAELAIRRVRTASAFRRAGAAFLVADVLIALGFVYAYGFDPVSAQWALLAVLPLEGALRFNLVGALGVWAAVTPLYLLRDLAFTGRAFEIGPASYRLGLLLVIALFAGFLARDLDEQRRILQGLSEGSRQFVGRVEPAEILRALCREAIRCLDAATAVAYVHDGTWFQSVASWPPDQLPVVVDEDQRENEDPQLAKLVLSGPTWLEADGQRPARLAVPLPGLDSASHVLVVRPRGRRRFSGFQVDAVAALAESAALALATSRVLAAEQRSNRRLRHLEALRTRFVATIAHDLRLPLTVFKGVSQLLRTRRESISSGQIDEMLASVERQSNRLSRLADDLLDAARLDADMLVLQLEECDLRDVVAATVVDFDEAITVEIDDEPRLVGDAARLERVLWNLLSNAEKYGKPPFIVTARALGDAVELEVRDHGSGLDTAQQTRLFSDFASSDDAASVGLGLAIVWQLVRAHGGTVGYEDASPGARFRVRLPTGGPAPESTPEQAQRVS